MIACTVLHPCAMASDAVAFEPWKALAIVAMVWLGMIAIMLHHFRNR